MEETEKVIYPLCGMLSSVKFTLTSKTSFTGEDLMNVVDTAEQTNPSEGLLKTYHTERHVQIYNFLASVMCQLEANEYKNTRGLNSHTLIGPRGIGSTIDIPKNHSHLYLILRN